MLRWPRIILEFLAVFITVITVFAGLTAWRLASQPITATTLTPYIETAIESVFPKTKAEIGSTILIWDNADHSIAVKADKVTLRDSLGESIASFPDVKLKLSVLALLRGRFLPSNLKISGAQIWLTRHKDGTLWFGSLGTGGNEEDATKETVSVWEAAKHFTQEMTLIGGLRKLGVTEATISVHDEETLQDWAINIPEVSLEYGLRGLKGRAKIEVAQKGANAEFEALYDFNHIKQEHAVKIQFQNINPSVLSIAKPQLAKIVAIDMPITGAFDITSDHELSVTAFGGKIQGGEGSIAVPNFWDKARAIKSFKASGRYDRATGRLEAPAIELDFGSPKLSLKVEGQKPPAPTPQDDRQQTADMVFTAKVSLSDLPLNKYAEFWPKPITPDASEWIASSLSKGLFTQGEATIKGSFVWNDLKNVQIASAEGRLAATNVTVNYIETMPRVEGVNAEATFDLKRMDINITSGSTGALKIQPFTIHMTDLEKDTQNIVIPLKVVGPIPDIIKLIDYPPLEYAKAIGLKPENTEGQAQGTVELKFPLLKDLLMKDIDVKAQAQLTGVGLHKVISGIDITQGSLALVLDTENYSLKGPASLNNVPLQLSWSSSFSKEPKNNEPVSRAIVSGTINEEQWKLLGLDMYGKVKGPSTATIQYDQINATMAQMTGDVDFRQADVYVDEINWKKPVGTSAVVRVTAEMPEGKDIQVKTLDMQGVGFKARGKATLENGTKRLMSVELAPLIAGRTNANIYFTQAKGETGELGFRVEGSAFDASGLTKGKEPARADPRTKDYELKVDQLYTSETGFIANAQIHARRDPLGWSQIELHGLADGGHQLDISLTESGGKRAFSLTCDDFGKMLKGAGFTDTVKDGEIKVIGQSNSNNPRVIEGTVNIGHFVVEGLPVLARLLSAASPFGFIDFVTGNASFDHLEGNFSWYGDTLELKKIRAAGSVFGLNIEGQIDLNTGESNLRGTMVPFSLFNKIINVIPLLGDVITGGEGGGVLAVAYSVKGNLSDPDIGVNPISLLTPGFLRNLFFEGEIEKAPVPEQQSEKSPQPEPHQPQQP